MTFALLYICSADTLGSGHLVVYVNDSYLQLAGKTLNSTCSCTFLLDNTTPTALRTHFAQTQHHVLHAIYTIRHSLYHYNLAGH